jgi:hypothetical protein
MQMERKRTGRRSSRVSKWAEEISQDLFSSYARLYGSGACYSRRGRSSGASSWANAIANLLALDFRQFVIVFVFLESQEKETLKVKKSARNLIRVRDEVIVVIFGCTQHAWQGCGVNV